MKKETTRGTRRAREESGRPGAGKRRRDVRGSPIYPGSGPLPPGRATIKTPGALGRHQSAAGTQTTRMLPKHARAHREMAVIVSGAPREIPHADWMTFLDDFSVQHEGWSTELRVFAPDQTSRLEVKNLPLQGVSIDFEAHDATALILVGTEAQDHVTHAIPHTTRLTVLNENELEIEAADRSRTMLRCRQQ
jgi:hypothetical protein